MRLVMMVCLTLTLALAACPAVAQEAEAVRRELEQMRKQFEAMKNEYQKTLDAMGERLQRLEAQPQTAATTPVAAQAPQAPASGGPTTLRELAQPRQPFALGERRGPGQFLFDMGVVGDFIANFASRNDDKADTGTFAGRENRLFPREIELLLFGQIDPYARGEVRIEAAEEFEDAQRKLEVGLAEANLTLLTLPAGLQLKLGRMRNRFGLLNQFHREGLPQPDQPNVLTRFLGEEGLTENGAELTWVAPLPFYLEALLGAFNGDNEVAFGGGSLRKPLLTGRLRTFFDLTDTMALQLGASVADGRTTERRHNTIVGADAKFKLIPAGRRFPLLTLGGEALYAMRNVAVGVDTNADGAVDRIDERDRDRFGWYAYGEVQPWRRWLGGLRFDRTQFPVEGGSEWAIEPYVAFMPSDFLRFRLAYKHTDRTHRAIGTGGRNGGDTLNEVFLQGTFFLGAHPAHPF